MSKKFMPLISALLIAVFILAACGQKATPAPVTEVPVVATLKGTITLWQGWKESEITSLNEVIAKFQAANPDVTFDVLYVPFDDLRGKFETETATGGGPSLLIGAADWGSALFNANLIADITADMDQAFLDTINPAALAATQYKGALIGLPESVKGVVLIRNKSIIASPAATFGELVTKAKAATTGDVKGAYLEYGAFFSMGHLMGLGGKLMEANGDPAFNDAKGVEWLNLLNRFKEAGDVTNYTDDDINLFKTGKVGYVIDGSWNVAAFADAIGKENIAVDPWPTPLSGFVQTENIYLNANATGDDRTAAVAFLKYFLSVEAQGILSDVGTTDTPKAGHLPATLGVTISDPLLNEQTAAFAGGVAFPVIPETNAFWDPINNATKKVVLDGGDPAAALQEAYDLVVTAVAGIRGQ